MCILPLWHCLFFPFVYVLRQSLVKSTLSVLEGLTEEIKYKDCMFALLANSYIDNPDTYLYKII